MLLRYPDGVDQFHVIDSGIRWTQGAKRRNDDVNLVYREHRRRTGSVYRVFEALHDQYGKGHRDRERPQQFRLFIDKHTEQ